MFRLNQSSLEVEQKMLVFLTISLLLAPLSECKLVKRSLASYPLAMCNDGTPANYYYTDDHLHATKLVINLEGGGACRDKEDCVKRFSAHLRYQKLLETGVQSTILGGVLNSLMRC